jgi:hypothetical protein
LFHVSALAPKANVAPSSANVNTAKIVFTNFISISSEIFWIDLKLEHSS